MNTLTFKKAIASAACAVALVAGSAAPALAAQGNPPAITVKYGDMEAGGHGHARDYPYNKIVLEADGDYAVCRVNLTEDTHDITIRGGSTTNCGFNAELYIGGQFVQSFRLDNSEMMYTIKGVHHVTGDNQEVRIVCKGDNYTPEAWPQALCIKSIRFENGRNEGKTGDNYNNEVIRKYDHFDARYEDDPTYNVAGESLADGQAQQQYGDARTFQTEHMKLGGYNTWSMTGPFDGIVLYEDGARATFETDFEEDTHDITIRGNCSRSKSCRVDLYIGDQFVKSFYWNGKQPTECTIKGLHHVTGANQEVRLVSQGNDYTYKAELDYIRFENGRNEGMTDGNVDNEVLYDGQAVDNIGLERDDKFNYEHSDEYMMDGEK